MATCSTINARPTLLSWGTDATATTLVLKAGITQFSESSATFNNSETQYCLNGDKLPGASTDKTFGTATMNIVVRQDILKEIMDLHHNQTEVSVRVEFDNSGGVNGTRMDFTAKVSARSTDELQNADRVCMAVTWQKTSHITITDKA